MRKENVTPSGTPACIKPRKRGIALQVQNGVMIPNKDAKILPTNSFFLTRILRIFSAGIKVLTKEMVKMIMTSRRSILIVSYMKKFTTCAMCVSVWMFKIVKVRKSATILIG
jgi:hypothetical protein